MPAMARVDLGKQASKPVEPTVLEPVVGRLEGHLTRAQLEQVLADVADQLRARQLAPVLLDCSAMDGYDLDARHAFVEWNKQWKRHVTRVAIVTHNRLYHVVIATMSLASGQLTDNQRMRCDFPEPGSPWTTQKACWRVGSDKASSTACSVR